MKKIPFLVAGLMLSLVVITTAYCNETVNPKGIHGSSDSKDISISSTQDLQALTAAWISEYSKINPAVKLNMSDSGSGDLMLITDRVAQPEANQWKMVIGHDAIVPVTNTLNPFIGKLNKQGISSDTYNQLIINIQNQNWGFLLSENINAPVHLYFIEDEGLKSGIAAFIKADKDMITGTFVPDAKALTTAIQNDVFAIGFCRLPDVMMQGTNNLITNISLLPIDKNRNGRLDNFENIYQNAESFMRGVWIGKYPTDLCLNIYAVAKQKPTDVNQLAFLEWIMSDGQNYLNSDGYTILSSYQSNSNINSITPVILAEAKPGRHVSALLIILIVAGAVLITFIIATIIKIRKTNRTIDSTAEVFISNSLNTNMLDAPMGLHYDKTHTWAFMERNGTVRIGIDDFMQHLTGKITRIKMKEPGDSIRKGEKILTLIKDGKQLNLYAPVSGIIKEQNQTLLDNSSLLNSSPYNEGWVYMIIPKNWSRETEFLFMVDKYREWLDDEFTRLKEFFNNSIHTNSTAYAHIVLQDGGELTDNVLADMEPEVWEDFQTRFIDISK